MKYINRELSWLQFNERVLEESYNSNHPILERLKFLAISGSNLDEFYSVRIAGIINQINHLYDDADEQRTAKQADLITIQGQVSELYRKQQLCWQQIRNELSKERISIVESAYYTNEDREWLRQHFMENIFPMLTPILVDKYHPIPHIPHLSLTIVVEVKNTDKSKGQDIPEARYVVIPLPKKLSRFVEISPNEQDKHTRFAIAEEVITTFLEELLPQHKILHTGVIRIIRDSELQVSDKADDLIKSFEKALLERMRGRIINLEISKQLDDKMMYFLTSSLNVAPECITTHSEFLGINSIMEIYKTPRAELKFKPYVSRFPERITDFHGDCFAAIENKDIIIHHPYETFDVVVQFLKQATKDPDVISIKQTLYRTSNDSPIVNALIKAARAGKNVTAIVEVKARFDEAANLEWGKNLLKAGAQVIFGIKDTKVHSKISLVVRKKGGKTTSYVHFGTGNYHPINAKIYSDLSFFTCDPRICKDIALLFNYMTDYTTPVELKELSYAPHTLKKDLIALIENEGKYAEQGKYGHIWMKANSLLDHDIIDALYAASSKGVKIQLIIRGICCLRPGIPGLSENITVKSIVGRFLEHARIFCFGNGSVLPSDDAKIYISSADLMPRNMNRRIEVMLPIYNETVRKQIMNKIMMANLVDRKQSWLMQADGTYERIKYDATDEYAKLSAHEYFMQNPSLSGRGSAIHGGITGTLANTSQSNKIAVIDIGSNSVRLVVYDKLCRTPIRLYNEKILCALGENIAKTGVLSPAGVTMTESAMSRFMKIVHAMKVNTIYCFATAAVRDASDGKDFIKRLENNCHITIQILSGLEEARFASLGVASGAHETHGVTGDLGGGSLELGSISFQRGQSRVFYEHDIVRECNSFPLGSLRLKTVSEDNPDAVEQLINFHLDNYPLHDLLKGNTFYAVGGGFRAIAKIHMTLNKHPIRVLHNYIAPATQILKTLEKILSQPPEKISRLPSLAVNRVDTIQVTAKVLHSIIRTGDPKDISFSTYGVREGIIFDNDPNTIKGNDALIDACTNIISYLSPGKGEQWIKFGLAFFEWSTPLFPEETPHMQRLRLAASILHCLAWHEHNAYKAETAFRWVVDSELPAIDHWERTFIATATFHRHQTDFNHKVTADIQSLLSQKWIERARDIGLALHLAHVLSGGTAQVLNRVPISIIQKKITLSCSAHEKFLLSPDALRYLKKLGKAMHYKTDVVEIRNKKV